jgi:hypothetical protein
MTSLTGEADVLPPLIPPLCDICSRHHGQVTTATVYALTFMGWRVPLCSPHYALYGQSGQTPELPALTVVTT